MNKRIDRSRLDAPLKPPSGKCPCYLANAKCRNVEITALVVEPERGGCHLSPVISGRATLACHGGPRRARPGRQQRTGARVLQTHPEKQNARRRHSDVPKPGRRGRAAGAGRPAPGQTDGPRAGREPGGGHPRGRGAGPGELRSARLGCQLVGDASPVRERRDQPEGCFRSGGACFGFVFCFFLWDFCLIVLFF